MQSLTRGESATPAGTKESERGCLNKTNTQGKRQRRLGRTRGIRGRRRREGKERRRREGGEGEEKEEGSGGVAGGAAQGPFSFTRPLCPILSDCARNNHSFL